MCNIGRGLDSKKCGAVGLRWPPFATTINNPQVSIIIFHLIIFAIRIIAATLADGPRLHGAFRAA